MCPGKKLLVFRRGGGPQIIIFRTMSFRKMEVINFIETSSPDDAAFQKTKIFVNISVRI